KLYKAVSEKFDIGDFDTFSSKMKTKEDRLRFYNAVSERGFDLGDYDTYENRLGKQREVSGQGSENTSSTYGEPSSVNIKTIEQWRQDSLNAFDRAVNNSQKGLKQFDYKTPKGDVVSFDIPRDLDESKLKVVDNK